MDTFSKELAARLFPEVQETIVELEKKYPPRQLAKGAEVTRLAPSPTGFLHIGALYVALIDCRVAEQTGGIFYLRIEDTDQEREVSGTKELIPHMLASFGIHPTEGYLPEGVEKGIYGPYVQSARKELYGVFVKSLVEQGRAYPCFMTKEELEVLRESQMDKKVRPGYYGEFARWRDATPEEVTAKLDEGAAYVIRFRSQGDPMKKFAYTDAFLGDMQIPENDEDFIVLKSDGLPTYHLAHVVDDYLMRTTFIIRGEEWWSSMGKHLELWQAFGLSAPRYGHVMPINIQEGSTVRKLSKRKDPIANVQYYHDAGYPVDAIVAYLYRLANPTFDDWWQSNHDLSTYVLSFDELRREGRGPLLDLVKMRNISADIIADYTASRAYDALLAWSEKYDAAWHEIIKANVDYMTAVLAIERGTSQPRKDIVCWSEAKNQLSYFFDELFDATIAREQLLSSGVNAKAIDAASGAVASSKNEKIFKFDTVDEWVEVMRGIAVEAGFALKKQEVSASPEKFHGDFALFMRIIRVLLTGQERTPNLCYIMEVMGIDRVHKRLQ